MVVELFTIVKTKARAWAWVVTVMLVLEVKKEGIEAPLVESSGVDVLRIIVARWLFLLFNGISSSYLGFSGATSFDASRGWYGASNNVEEVLPDRFCFFFTRDEEIFWSEVDTFINFRRFDQIGNLA